MTLDTIKQQTTWNDAAASINSNFAKLLQAIIAGVGNEGFNEEELRNFLESSGYTTDEWVLARGYITASSLVPYAKKEDLSSYATKGELTSAIDGLNISQYATKAALNTLEGKHDTLRNEFNALSNLLSSDTSDYINTWNEVVAFLDGYKDEADLATILSGMNADISSRLLTSTFTTWQKDTFTPLSELVANHTTRLNGIDTSITNINTRIDGVEDEFDTFRAEYNAFRANFEISDDLILVRKNFASTEEMSSHGINQGTGGGGGSSFSRLDSWADYDSNKAGYVLSAYLGYDLNSRLTVVENKKVDLSDYYTKVQTDSKISSAVGAIDFSPYAKTLDIAKTYATKNELSVAIDEINELDLNNRVQTIENSYISKNAGGVINGGLVVTSLAISGGSSSQFLKADGSLDSTTYLSGITSSMVVSALEYTPFNTASFTKDNIKKTLGISDWAMASSKPSYKTSEITEETNLFFTNSRAISAVSGSYIAAKSSSGYDVDACFDAGLYMVKSGSNVPSGSNYGALLSLPYRKAKGNSIPDFGTQIFLPNGDDSTNPNDMYFRTSLSDSWNDWQIVLTTSNLTEQLVVGALGYTPYNAANFTKANIKSTLGISDWALAASRPTYSWTDIASRPTNLSQFTDDVVSGKYLPLTGGTLTGILTVGGASIHPTVGNPYFQLYQNNKYWYWQADDNYTYIGGTMRKALQIDQEGNTTIIGQLTASNINGYTPITSGNYSQYAPTLTGTGASGTWGISAYGLAKVGANASGRYNANELTSGGMMVNGSSFTLWDNAPMEDVGFIIHFSPNRELYYSLQLCGNGWSNDLFMRNFSPSGVWNEWKQLAFTDSNVASAQALTHSNGTVGAIVNLSGNVTIDSSDLAGTGYKLWVNGTTNIEGNLRMTGELIFAGGYSIQSYNNAALSLNPQGNNILLSPNGYGNVGIGTTSPQYKLHVAGSGFFSGAVTVSGTTKSERYLLSNSEDSYCGLMPNSTITASGNTGDIWLYNNQAVKLYGGKGVMVASSFDVQGAATFSNNVNVHDAITIEAGKELRFKDNNGVVHSLRYDSAKQAFVFDGNVNATGEMSAKKRINA